MKHDDPMVSDEGMNVLLAPVVQAVAAYGRAESDRMGAVIVLAAYGVVEFRCRALIRAAVKQGLEMAADKCAKRSVQEDASRVVAERAEALKVLEP